MTATSTPPTARQRRPAKPRGPIVRAFYRARLQLARVVALLLLLAVSGMALGLVLSFPISRLQFSPSGAIRLDQANLVGQLEAESALVAAEDLPVEWVPGDPALGGFGLLGSTFCGTTVELPTALSDDKVVVFQNPSTGSVLIGQSLRIDKWQAGRDYVAQVDRALKDCDEFYASGFSGPIRSRIEDPPGSPAITDSVGATYRSLEEPLRVTEWTILAVGDLLLAVSVTGLEESPEQFLDTVENRILTRLDPADFAPSASSTTTTAPGG
ncbi:MAG: hypothetical protein FJW94_10980 [Actinobacteria bacterium]|nr:hypothetical protein [Actinomycetota bacterium]